MESKENDSWSSSTYVRQAEILRKMGAPLESEDKEQYYNQALIHLDKAIEKQIESGTTFELCSQTLDPYIKKTELLEEMERYDEALECLDSLPLEEINDLYLLVAKARITGKAGHFDQAIKMFDEVIETCPEFREPYIEKADLYFEKGEFDLSKECYEKWLSLDGDKK